MRKFKVAFKRPVLILFLTGLCMFCISPGSAQDPVRNAGNIRSVKISGQTVNISTDNAVASVTVYSPNIIRVRIDRQKLKDDQSYAVVMLPTKVQVNFKEDEKQVVILTDSLKVRIQRTPFSIGFFTLDDKVINEDEPGLTTSWVGDEVTAYRHMQEHERFIGLGEKTGDLDRHGSGYTNWNTDAFAYITDRDPIYSSIPFYIGIHHAINYGIFLDNTFQTDFNFGASNDRFSSFGARGGEMNYYFIYHTRLADIIKSYTAVTGRMNLPPLWSLGYQQNRYSYYPDTEVLRIAQTLREKLIPADGITLDIHYMDRYQLFTWNKERFPNPPQLTAKLRDMGFSTTVIVDPGIKIEPGAAAFEKGLKEDVFIKYPDGKNYAGAVWPGWCNFTDFTSEKGRNFWRNQMKFFSDNGVRGIWNDMNEIATWGQKIPSNVMFDFEGRKGTILEAHNVYGSLMARSSYEGARAATNQRPFILSRAGYAGMQRYTAIWTGDNRAEDSHMILGIRLLNSLGLSGMPFTGMDIGGFSGNPSQALYGRWIQLGAFTPYFRNHTAINTKSAEPWTFGEEITDISRNYISLRYKLLPYLYSAFYEATQSGLPIMRSLAIDHTFDPKIYDHAFQNQYCFGPSLMVIPVESGKEFTKVYFPSGNWYDLYNDQYEEGAKEKLIELSVHKLPVYVKESSIIPMQTLVQSTAIQPSDTLFLHIYKGNTPNTFVYYEDDGKSFDYEKGNYYRRNFRYDPGQNRIILERPEGQFTSKFRNIMLVMHGFNDQLQLQVNGIANIPSRFRNAFLSTISAFDPQGRPVESDMSNTLNLLIKNESTEITINY